MGGFDGIDRSVLPPCDGRHPTPDCGHPRWCCHREQGDAFDAVLTAFYRYRTRPVATIQMSEEDHNNIKRALEDD